MSTDSDKPFVCQVVSCGQRFANHDHLTQHQQKHEFSLKFKGGDVSLIDQTPTPTRFLRTCEESGLFQELEEANPFEQDFKDATTTTGSSSAKSALSVSHTSSAASREKPPKVTEVIAQTVVEPLPRVSSVATATIPVAPPASLINPDKPVAMASAPAHVSTASALTKQKLLQNIQMKEQQKLLEQVLTQQFGGSQELLTQALKSVIPQVTTIDNSDHAPSEQEDEEHDASDTAIFLVPTDSPGRRKRGRKPDDEDPEIKRQRFLERNRAAASRCRAKKKQWVDNLEKKAKDMESVNSNLQQEVMMLRSEVQQLKSILIAHKDCPLIVHHTKENGEGGDPSGGGVTLLAKLANMPSMSPLITSPVPSVGSVVPNITPGQTSVLSQQHVQTSLPATIVITTNGISQQTPEVAKDVEIAAEVDHATSDN